MDVDELYQSQDVLRTQYEHINVQQEDEPSEPWIDKWTCEDAPVAIEAWQAQTEQCLTDLENAGRFFLLDSIQIPLSEIVTTNGILFVFGKAMQELSYLRKGGCDPTNYFKLLNLLEFAGCNSGISDESLEVLINKISRLMLQIKNFSITGKSLKNNIFFHVVINTWNMVVTVFARAFDQKKNSLPEKKFMDLLAIISETLVKLYSKYGVSVPCKCSQNFLITLYYQRSANFFQAFFSCFNSPSGPPTNTGSFIFCQTMPISSVHYFLFYIDCFDYFMSIKGIDPKSDLALTFTQRAFAMSERLMATNLIDVCQQLLKLIKNHSPRGVDKSKKAIKTLWKHVTSFLENETVLSLESLMNLPSYDWATEVYTLFPSSPEKEICVITILGLLLAEKSLWDSTRSVIYNSLNCLRNNISNCFLGAQMSLYLTVFAHCSDPIEFGSKFCEWLGDTSNNSTEVVLTTFFSTLDVIRKIAEIRKISIPTDDTMVKLFNKISLPNSSHLFVNQLAIYGDRDAILRIDLEKAGKQLTESEFSRFVSFISNAGIPLSESALKRCTNLLNEGKANEDISNLLISKLRLNLQNNPHSATLQLMSIRDRLLYYEPLPSPGFVFSVCNTILEPPKVLRIYDPFVPCWISAVCIIHTSYDNKVLEMTKFLWAYFVESFKEVCPNEECLDPNLKEDPYSNLKSLINALAKVQNINPEWVRDKTALWLPSELAKQLQHVILACENNLMNSLAINFLCLLYTQLTPSLFEVMKLERSRNKSLNQTTFVILLSCLSNKKLLNPPPSPIIINNVLSIVSQISKISYDVFVCARIRAFITGMAELEVCQKLVDIFKDNPTNEYSVKLRESDPKVKQILLRYGFLL